LAINSKSHDHELLNKQRDTIDFSKPVNKKRQAEQVVLVLAEGYPLADCTLDYREPWKLLISGILAAQCTDARVNVVCKSMFEVLPTMQSIADADLSILEEQIRSCGFYHVKARSIKSSMQRLLSEYHGEVPSTLEELVTLPGVGRKIANLILGDSFGKQAIVVDTHCARISKHLGLTDSVHPVKIEQDLMKCIPKNEWTNYGHRMVAHGRAVCIARNPRCSQCTLRRICKKGMESVE